MTRNRPNPRQQCILNQYTPGWEMGTGIPTSLAPGSYRITNQKQIGGVTYWDLDETYRVDSRRITHATSS